MRGWQANSKTHLCVACIIRAMPETEIPPRFAGGSLFNDYSLFCSPQSHIWSRMGIRDFPRSVRLYSTFGGICGYSSR